MLIGFLNVQSLPPRKSAGKNFDLTHTIRDFNFSHLGLAEVNINWGKINDENRPPARYRGHFNQGQLAFSYAYNKHDTISGAFQYGGTASITTGENVGRLDGKPGSDESELGRYSWHKLRGKSDTKLRVLTFYRPCRPSNNGAESAYGQQLSHFNATGRLQCPRNAIMEDLKKLIKKWLSEGDQIIVMGDLNEYIRKKSTITFFDQMGMRELIMERHGDNGPATTLSNKSRQAVDGIWATRGVQIMAGGYLPFYEGIISDHRLIWVKIAISYIFGSIEMPLNCPVSRVLRMDDDWLKERYKKYLRKFAQRHKLEERMTVLTANMCFPATEEQAQEFEEIDRLRMKGRIYAIEKCKKLYVSGIASTPKMKRVRLKLRLLELISTRNTQETKIKWSTIDKLAKRTKSSKYLDMNNMELSAEKRSVRKEFYKLKKEGEKTRTTKFEEKAKAHTERGEIEEAQRLHQLLANEMERERASRLKKLQASENRRGVVAVTVDTPVLQKDKSIKMSPKLIMERSELEQACMKEVDRRNRMSEGSPPMVEPLVDLLEYTSNTPFGEKILNGEAKDIYGIDEHTQLYLDQLAKVRGAVCEPVEPLPFDDYCSDVKRLREKTSSGPTRVSPAMIKTECEDEYLSSLNWKAANFPWCTGYSPNRFKRGVDLLIYKKLNDNRVTKLRPILLFDLESNMHNKRVGRNAMEKAEACDGIAPEQFGSRQRKAADLQALNTRLFYDYAKIKRHSGVSMFIDLVSNYDLVTHSIATLAFRRVGMPLPPILCMFDSLQNMVHSVRTAYGDSLDTYGGDLWVVKINPPPQGLGQGNGGAPQAWALVSTPLLNAIRDKGYGAVFKCSISKNKFKLVGYCFVDDSTMVQLAPTPDKPTKHMVQLAQDELDLYSGLARATGGQVSPENGKNSWYLLEYQWDKNGKWSFATNEGDIYVKTKEGKVKVERIPCDVASRILGVWIAPSGCNERQVKELKDITLAWADRVRSGHLRSSDAWFYYQTTVQKSLEYPLLATTLTEKECRSIERPALEVALQSSSLPSNYPRDVLFGPPEHMGNGASRMFHTQGVKHIRAIMDHGCNNTITGEKMRAIIELHKVELGTGQSLFETNYNTFKGCATDTWVTWTWGYMWENECCVEERTPNLRLHRENDNFLMLLFAEDGWRGSELETLNRCRLFLQICTLSDVTSGDGSYVIKDVLEGRKILRDTPYEWPVQGRPAKNHWKLWERALRSALDLGRNERLPSKRRLGRWLDKNHSTGWKYSPSRDRVYLKEGGGWIEVPPIIERRGKDAQRRYNREGVRCIPPEDAKTTICRPNKYSYIKTGDTDTIQAEGENQKTLPQLLTQEDAKLNWALADVLTDDEGKYIAEEIKKGSAIAVSDGTNKDQRSAAACVIEGTIPFLHRIIATATSPGEGEIQDAYRGELTGLYMAVLIVHMICQAYNIKKGSITIACDGIEAIKKGFDEYTFSSCRSSQFDLISAIRNLTKISPIKWNWRHVHGHQDDFQGPLDRWATLNVEMDERAKARRRQDEKEIIKPQYEIAYESWRLYTGLPEERNSILPSSHKVSHGLDNELDHLINGKKIKKYWSDHFIIPKEAMEKIDWNAIQKARNKTNFMHRKWASKWAAEIIPTGTVMQDRKAWDTAECPRKCGEEMETCEHVILCPKANQLWLDIQKTLFEWAQNSKSRPGLMAAITQGISQWRNGDTHSTNNIKDPLLQAAFREQNTIGWEALLKGFLSKKWQEAQQDHFKKIKSRKSGRRHISQLIKKLFDVSWDFWNHRNHFLHKEDSKVLKELTDKLDRRIDELFSKGPSGLPKRCNFLFHQPIHKIIRKHLRSKLAWLASVSNARMRKIAKSKDVDRTKDPDVILLRQFQKGGFLRKMSKRKAKIPKLRTNANAVESSSWHQIEREEKYAEYEEQWNAVEEEH